MIPSPVGPSLREVLVMPFYRLWWRIAGRCTHCGLRMTPLFEPGNIVWLELAPGAAWPGYIVSRGWLFYRVCIYGQGAPEIVRVLRWYASDVLTARSPAVDPWLECDLCDQPATHHDGDVHLCEGCY